MIVIAQIDSFIDFSFWPIFHLIFFLWMFLRDLNKHETLKKMKNESFYWNCLIAQKWLIRFKKQNFFFNSISENWLYNNLKYQRFFLEKKKSNNTPWNLTVNYTIEKVKLRVENATTQEAFSR